MLSLISRSDTPRPRETSSLPRPEGNMQRAVQSRARLCRRCKKKRGRNIPSLGLEQPSDPRPESSLVEKIRCRGQGARLVTSSPKWTQRGDAGLEPHDLRNDYRRDVAVPANRPRPCIAPDPVKGPRRARSPPTAAESGDRLCPPGLNKRARCARGARPRNWHRGRKTH